MPWLFWKSWTSGKDSDPLRTLDPTLREFLEKESPVKYKTSPAPVPPTPSVSQATSTTQTATQETPPATRAVPKEALYQDGRYAYLWEGYRPQAEIDAETKSDQEKLADIFGGYKVRKTQIAQAAVENCSFEQQEIDVCYEHGSYWRRLLMCRPESRKFDRCFVTQSRFLKALGYMSTYERTEDVDEEIQMHADLLYHRMLDQEAAIDAAKEAGQPIPTFPPILARPDQRSARQSFWPPIASTTPAPDDTSSSSSSPPQPGQPLTPAEANRAAVVKAKGRSLPPLDPEVEQKLKPEAAIALRRAMKGMNATEREVQQRSKIQEMEDAVETGLEIIKVRNEAKQRKKEYRESQGEWGKFIKRWIG